MYTISKSVFSMCCRMWYCRANCMAAVHSIPFAAPMFDTL